MAEYAICTQYKRGGWRGSPVVSGSMWSYCDRKDDAARLATFLYAAAEVTAVGVYVCDSGKPAFLTIGPFVEDSL